MKEHLDYETPELLEAVLPKARGIVFNMHLTIFAKTFVLQLKFYYYVQIVFYNKYDDS